MTFNPFISPCSQQLQNVYHYQLNDKIYQGALYSLTVKDKVSVPETHRQTRPACEYTRPVVKRVGEEKGALKAEQGLPSCAPHPVTKHRIHHFVYFSQLSAYKKGLGATWLSGHLLAALKQADKTRPLRPPPFGLSKGSSGLPFPSSPSSSCPTPCLLLLHWLSKNKALGSSGLLQRAGSSHWINQGKKAR